MRRGRKPIHIEIQPDDDPNVFKFDSLNSALLDVIDLLAEAFDSTELNLENDRNDQAKDENERS